MNSPIKYPGGKNNELNVILPNFPKKMNRFFEPFVGGGAVYFNVNKEIPLLINDKSEELINFYIQIKNRNNDFLDTLSRINNTLIFLPKFVNTNKDNLISIYQDYKDGNNISLSESISEFITIHRSEFKNYIFIYSAQYKDFEKQLFKSVFDKYKRIRNLENKHGHLEDENDLIDNITTGFMSAYYTFNRTLFNFPKKYHLSDSIHASYYFYIREYCYSSMFRYNKDGHFNVPYGGKSYNLKTLSKKISYLKSDELVNHLQKTTIKSGDFYEFLSGYELTQHDFLFLDPPYDTEFSTYANNTFDVSDQERLAHYLINDCPAKFMLVIKNSELIAQLYAAGTRTLVGDLEVFEFKKNYLVSFRNRNNKRTSHLLITNYPI